MQCKHNVIFQHTKKISEVRVGWEHCVLLSLLEVAVFYYVQRRRNQTLHIDDQQRMQEDVKFHTYVKNNPITIILISEIIVISPSLRGGQNITGQVSNLIKQDPVWRHWPGRPTEVPSNLSNFMVLCSMSLASHFCNAAMFCLNWRTASSRKH